MCVYTRAESINSLLIPFLFHVIITDSEMNEKSEMRPWIPMKKPLRSSFRVTRTRAKETSRPAPSLLEPGARDDDDECAPAPVWHISPKGSIVLCVCAQRFRHLKRGASAIYSRPRIAA